MKKKFHKSGNMSDFRMDRLKNSMIAQISAQVSAFMYLESIEKGKGFCGFPYLTHFDKEGDDLEGYLVYNPKNDLIIGRVTVDVNEENCSKDSTPIYQCRFVKSDSDRKNCVRLEKYLMCLSEAFCVCKDKVLKVLDLYDDGVIAVSIVQNSKYIWLYAWIRRDAEIAEEMRKLP